jgi:hypothetical protein
MKKDQKVRSKKRMMINIKDTQATRNRHNLAEKLFKIQIPILCYNQTDVTITLKIKNHKMKRVSLRFSHNVQLFKAKIVQIYHQFH